jgi:hypothetical protein
MICGHTVRITQAAFLILAAVLPHLVTLPSAAAASPPDKVDFNRHIKPLLSDRCYKCHGPDETARKAKLRLDQKESAFKKIGDAMFVIKPHELAKSEVYRRVIATDPEDLMPPPESNLSLNPEEIALIKRWIEQGAEWEKHWSFVPVRDVPSPAVTNMSWLQNDIDRFILARLEAEGFAPSPEASKQRLLRRVTFDLTGLPPTLEEIDGFLSDNSEQAYERVVDRLLASPAYGERMAVEWLDVARYADTYGYQEDRFNHMWPWRDWVIRTFNKNLPFDEFIIWQLAGDLLPNATREQKMATAFNRNHRQTNEGGSIDEEFRVEYNADRVHTTAGAFLGLTMECARCHDHRFDPITQKDYYRLFAFFNSTDESGLYSHFTDAIPSPALLLFENDAQERKCQAMKGAIAAKEKELGAPSAEGDFQHWLRRNPQLTEIKGLVGHYTFDTIRGGKCSNQVSRTHTAKLSESPKSVEGRFGRALEFSGENAVTIEKLADFRRSDPFSISLWLKIPEELEEMVVLHHQRAGSGAGYNGYQLVLESGKASFGLIHFWPGNAINVRTKAKLKTNEWLQLTITYDGSSRASGVQLYLNGKPAEVEIVRDNLYKDFANDRPLTLAARFRGRGFKGGQIDDLRIFNCRLTPVEVAVVYNPNAKQAPTLEYYLAHFNARARKLAAELKKAREEENQFINSIPELMIMGDLPSPRPTYLLKRGAYDAHGEQVEPGTPEAILPFDSEFPKNRLGLARWVVDPKNPLTSRVLVNRYWQMFFGRGIVVTTEDFGSQGQLPSHPELLDWLARHFMDSAWNLKALHKLIVMSATYRQSSEASPELLARDPENSLLARGPKNRLTAEMLRDHALACAGLLVRKSGGPSVKPYQPEGLWEEKSSDWKYEPDKGESLYRRGMYTYWKRASQHPAMTTFDAAERNTCIVRRQTTSTPLQALVLLNDPQFVEAARETAERTLKEAGPESKARIIYMFRLLTSRSPNEREVQILKRLLDDQWGLFNDRKKADSLIKIGEAPVRSNAPRSELAAYAVLASAIMNFDDATMKR